MSCFRQDTDGANSKISSAYKNTHTHTSIIRFNSIYNAVNTANKYGDSTPLSLMPQLMPKKIRDNTMPFDTSHISGTSLLTPAANYWE